MRWNHASITDRKNGARGRRCDENYEYDGKKKLEMANYITFSPGFYAVYDKYPKSDITNIFK